ncbi:YsnF/AvaK domain-containing protein [Massilia psychrophila]|uniref:DUF2382 domain-containing protein n=1 Tax=Massilia psychrophila TaxID=1603353 RepID=A0A2G8T4G5_9BURK|nr:YsnF/AvaK domain-containing protein [Massilia psychrophila]PIL40950.1 hypothetical protein CR103_04200 [Massilia psychrophila]GGE69070.1 hypothetical protein GCM10008020_11830 [Massilia psychrophila]
MQHTLVAVFDNRADAQSAMEELLASGFSSQEVRMSQETGDTTGAMSPTSSMGTTSTTGITGTTGTTGATDEGFGSGIKNFFSDLFGSDHDEPTRKYSEAVTRGSHVLTVSTATLPEVERAADLIERFGPIDIDEKTSQWGGGATTGAMAGGAMAGGAMSSSTGSQQQAALLSQQSGQGSMSSQQGSATGGSQQLAPGESTAIPVIQEQLQVGKREVQRGGVRVFQRMVETPVSETVNLREEHVSIERHPVDQPATPADLAAFQEKTIELHETAEEVVIQKTARVVEEVVVGKDVTQIEQQVSDTVRHTEVEIEQLDAGTGTGTSTGSAMGTGMTGDDTYYRNHFNSNYASAGGRYEDYAPAYGYGSTMAGNDQYRGRAWNDVEPSLRSDWETRNPGSTSTWEKMKGSVRHGWEKMTS